MNMFFLAAAFTGLTLFSQVVPLVEVKVRIEPLQGTTTYHYRVVNNGSASITAVTFQVRP